MSPARNFASRRSQGVQILAGLALATARLLGTGAETNLAAGADSSAVRTARSADAATTERVPVDLPGTLRLAGAENLDVQLAIERVREARAVHDQARLQYFPWLAPGMGYRGHDGRIQDVAGRVIDVDKQSYTAGVGLTAQVNLGEAIYQSLAARQRALAADAGSEVQRQESVLLAASRYFELSRATAAVGAASEAVRIAEDYAGQVRRAVEAGIAFAGDGYRTEVQVQRNRGLRVKAEELRRVAAARLAEVLRLPPSIDLVAAEPDLAVLGLAPAGAPVDSSIAKALAARPELRRSSALSAAADAERQGAVRGPWIPTLGAQAFGGGLGGGPDGRIGAAGASADYFFGLGWRIGPGGLFDRGRIRAAESRQRTSRLEAEKTRLEVQRQVVEADARYRSLADQVVATERALAAAGELFRLCRERREFGVGVVLETIQAEQELTRARLEYLQVVAERNQATYAFRRSLGE